MRKTLNIVVTSLILLCAWGVSGVFAQSGTGRPFITKWKGTKGEMLKIPIVGKYKIVIKDENGKEKVNETVTVSDIEHPYIFTPTEEGTYTVEAGPEGVKYMRMKAERKDNKEIPLTSNDKLLEVVQFGTVKWASMAEMFKACKNMTFAAGIDTPDLSEVTNMKNLFFGCSSFNQPLNDWNVSNVYYMWNMFKGCRSFNQPLDNWDVSNVVNMEMMFYDCHSFNQPLEKWNVSKVTRMAWMFEDCSSFNQPLNSWDVSNVTRMEGMFIRCHSFNQPLGNWDVTNVTEMDWMFKDCSSFNQPLNSWDVSKVTNMNYMFCGCSAFNQLLNNWDVSNVTRMEGMFSRCHSFNQPLDNWDVSKVAVMSDMFKICSAFNQPLDNWNVSNVEYMGEMFSGCTSFNQPLGNWDVSKVTNMNRMFEDCSSFNQPLGSWKIKTYIIGLSTTAMSPSNYSKTLIGWAEQTDIAKDLDFGNTVKGLIYNDQGKAARQKLMDKGWRFYGDIHQSSGVAITPRFFPLVLNKEYTLPLEKWGVEDTEEVTLSTDKGEIISYELTADKKGVHIKGLKEGKCKLTATIAAKAGVHDAYTSTCEIEVYIPIERFTITPASKTLKVGEEFTLTVHFFPENATKREVEWSSGNNEIVRVDDNGKVTAQKAGECRIYAGINEYGRRFNGKCEVSVEEAGNGENTGGNGNNGGNNGGGNSGGNSGNNGGNTGGNGGGNNGGGNSGGGNNGGNSGNNGGGNGGNNGGNTGGDNNGSNPTTFVVTLTRPTNGKIEIEGHATKSSITVAKDTELTVKATPNEGYKLKTLKANNKDITTTLKFTVTAATTVTAVFEKETFVVTHSVNDEKWGSIELAGASDLTAVPYGTELTVKITEKEGYKLKSLTAGDEDITTALKFTVKAATEVKAIFESKQGGAVEDALLAGIAVAPNPFSAQLRILNPEGVAARYELVNAAGMVVRSGALSGREVLVDTETLPAGIYFVRIEAQNGARKTLTVSK